MDEPSFNIDSIMHRCSFVRCLFLCDSNTACFFISTFLSKEKCRLFTMSMGYEKDIFAVFAYEFEPSQFLHKNIRLVRSCDDMLFF